MTSGQLAAVQQKLALMGHLASAPGIYIEMERLWTMAKGQTENAQEKRAQVARYMELARPTLAANPTYPRTRLAAELIKTHSGEIGNVHASTLTRAFRAAFPQNRRGRGRPKKEK